MLAPALTPKLDLPRLLPSALSPTSQLAHKHPAQHSPTRSSFSSAASRTSCTSESSTTASLTLSPEIQVARAVAHTLREARPRRMTLGEGSARPLSVPDPAQHGSELVPPVPAVPLRARAASSTTGHDRQTSATSTNSDRLQVPAASQRRRREGKPSPHDLPDLPCAPRATTLVCPLPPVPAKHPLLPRPTDALECLRDLWKEIELLDSDAREELGRQRATIAGIQVVVHGIKRRERQHTT